MVTKKVCTVFLVDVSPTMHTHLGAVGDNLSRIVQNKMLNSKIDEFALVLCGADETSNDVHAEGAENAAAAGDDDYEDEYLYIAVDVPMACATPAAVDRIAAVSTAAGANPADYLDALTVASDMLVRHERGGGFARRIVFVTDLRTPCEAEDAFMEGIVAGMRAASVQLTVAVVGGGEGIGTLQEGVEATVEANRDMLSCVCAGLNAAGLDGAVVAATSRSRVDDASNVLLAAQVKQTKPTTTFRGELEFTPWVSLKVWVYKKVSEQKPPSMKRCNEEGGEAVDEVKRETTYMSYADPDAPVDVPSEMMISAWPYGPTNIPIQEDVRKLMASKNEKGMKICGFTPLETVPHWYGMEEARVLVPWPTKDVSAAAGLAASAGASEREAGKAAAAMSALARAMERKGVAALTRAVWSQNSDKVNFGALTPHIIPEGDFLLFTPMPYSEDMYSSDFKPLPVTGSAVAAQLTAAAAAKLVPTEAQRAAAAALVDALDGLGPTPWKLLNPALTRTHALLHARAVDELALPLAPPAGGGPAAAAALTTPPLSSFARHPTLLGCGDGVHRGGDNDSGADRGGGGGEVVPATAATAADVFQAACGGLQLAEPRGAWRKRNREEAAAGEALPATEGEKVVDAEPEREQRRRTDDGSRRGGGGGGGGGGSGVGGSAAAAEETTAAGGSGGAGDAGDDAWVHIVKDEPRDDDGKLPDVVPSPVIEEHHEVELPPPVEDDGFFDDME